jgi:DNA-binding XRE family transcriptional regulator
VTETLVSRARRGTGRTQRDAASAAAITPQTFSAYETGRVVPSRRRTLRLLRSVALGRRRRGEPESSLLLFAAFHLGGGVRLLADEEGIPLSFPTPEQAHAVCELLDEYVPGLRSMILPVWPGWRGAPEIVRRLDPEDDASAAKAAAVALAAVVENAPGWLVE